jgi:hypothetical protein
MKHPITAELDLRYEIQQVTLLVYHGAIHSAQIGTEWWSDCVGSAFMNTAVMRVADLSRNMMEGSQLWRTHLTIIIMEDEDAGHSAAWYLDNFAQKAGIASPAALGHAFMDTAVTRVADFVKNMVEKNQRANQQPTPSAYSILKLSCCNTPGRR